jgi:hypothetical protein
MNQDALRTAVALYEAGTLDDEGAARYLGITLVGWTTYRDRHGIAPPSVPAAAAAEGTPPGKPLT